MGTTQRLGIDIVGTDRTQKAFMSAQRSMTSFNRTASQIKTAFAGFAGGNLLASFMRSMVGINKVSLPVKTAIDNLSAAWTGFGLKVGEGGLNSALINFANNMNKMLSGTDGLSASIGKLMGGAVNGMSKAFEGIGRSIAFVYDNFAIFNRVAFAFIGIQIAKNIAFAGYNFLLFAAAVRNTGLAMGIFNVMTSLGKKGILGLAAGGLLLASSFDEVKGYIDAMIAKMEDGLGPAFEYVRKGMDALGFDTKALKMSLAGGIIGQGMPGSKLDESTGKLKNFVSGIEDLKSAGSSASEVFQEVGQTFTSAFSSGLQSIIDKTSSVKEAFSSMAQSILNSLTNLFANKAMEQLFGSSGGSSGGGILGSFLSTLKTGYNTSGPGGTTSLSGFGGFYANGGRLGAGKWGIAGENGPEPIVGPATVIPNSASGAVNVKVNIINQAGVDVQQRQSSDGRGLDVLITNKVNDVLGSGKGDKVMRARFGATPQKARR